MCFLKAIFLGILVIIFGCNQSDKSITSINPGEPIQTSSCSDPVNSDFYNFLKSVITNLDLDTTYGLEEVPLTDLGGIESDSSFLQQRLIMTNTPRV